MADSEAILTAIMQVTIQAATVGSASGASTAYAEEAHRSRHGRQALRQQSFDWKAPDKYVELLIFEMEVRNMLQTRTYELKDEDKVPIM